LSHWPCTDAKRRESDAASRTRSLRRNWPGAAEIAGKPPAVASATPGVLRKKVSGIDHRYYMTAKANAPLQREVLLAHLRNMQSAIIEVSKMDTAGLQRD